jgi:hypothetical protein
MHTDIEIERTTNSSQIRILLAESDSSESALIRSNVNLGFQNTIKIVNNYNELLASILQEQPQLVLLGKIDKSTYSEIVQACHKLQENLPIFLLSRQKIIIDSYRKLVKSCGLTDIIVRDSAELNQLLLQILDLPILEQSINQPPEQPSIVGRMMLAALEEIVTVSNNYFGPLAQGNYWRKAHARIVDKFPSLQKWSADHFSKLSCDESILERELTDKDIQSLRIWVEFFIEECERSIVDYRTTLSNSDLSPSVKDLLTKS